MEMMTGPGASGILEKQTIIPQGNRKVDFTQGLRFR